ncbi:MAG: hypothetical protein PUD22_08830 [Erysipelotrichaceae bacterium]|nr:hypothetical protein [Erysipelotrichaceae bacterium]
MIIKKMEKMLLVRYSDFLFSNCIEEHKKIIEKNGYCWFGKVGKQKPSKKFCDIVLKNERPMIFLHSAKKCYICDVENIVFEKPDDNAYPEYYNDILYDKGNYPSAYFKIRSCYEIEKAVLSNFIVSSSRNLLPSSLHSSMNSIFLVECNNNIEIRGVDN